MEKVRIFFVAGLLTAAAVSEAAVATLPYRQQFPDEASLADFTVIDGDGNGRTWKTDMSAACNPGNQDKTDDWLITPGFSMEKGKMYNVRFTAWGSSYYEMFEVKVGTDPSAAGMTESFVEARQVQANSFSPLSVEEVFVPQADGVYYFGFHSVTADRNFYIDNLEIDAPVTVDAPEAVADLNVIPDQNGLNRAEITFIVPSKTVGGNDLTEISGVRVQRDDEIIANKTDVLPGQKVTVEDAVPAAGYYTYSVFAFNDSGVSTASSVTLWVGVNKPGPVTEVEACETSDGEVLISWAIPGTDIDGKNIDPSLLSYRITEITDGHEVVVAEKCTKPTFTYRPEIIGTQEFKGWSVEAVSEGGVSNPAYTAIMAVGTPYAMPFAESFAQGKPSLPMGLNTVEGDAAWDYFVDGKMVRDIFSQDNDGGFAGMRGQDMSSALIYTGKIKIEGENPVLTLFVNSFGSTDENELEIMAQEGEDMVRLKAFELCDLPSRGWNYVTVPLSQFKGHQIQLHFMATVWSYNYTFIDNIRVGEAMDCNLNAKKIDAPAEVPPNEPFSLSVSVENLGQAVSPAYTVELYRDGELLTTESGEGLGSGLSAEISFADCLGVTSPESVEYHAVVKVAGDGDEDDNISAVAKVSLKLHPFPAVSDLAAELTDGGVSLSWSAPDASAGFSEPVTESFEDYEPFTATPGDWTFIDMDHGKIGGLGMGEGNQTVEIPGIPVDSQQSWWVWDVETVPLAANGAQVTGASGNKFIVQMYNYDPSQTVPNDDWAISPELSGEAQTVTFYARSFQNSFLETFEFLYSTAGKNPDDFILVERKHMIGWEWALYSFEIPDGAKYFAIRCTSENKFMLFVDDVTFTPRAATGELAIEGYNIYRYGEKINDAPVTATSFTDPVLAECIRTYVVSTVYDRGESRVSNAVTVGSSGIADVVPAGDVTVAVEGREIIVTGAEGHSVAVYTVDGRIVFTTSAAPAALNIPVGTGLYVVKASSIVTKVIVK